MTVLLLLAGCAGSVPALDGSGGSGDATQTGRMNFYVSDEQNAIGDFEHLNVTVTAVAFQHANASADGAAEATTDGNETDGDASGDASANTSTETYSRAEVQDKQASEDWVVRDIDNRSVDLTTLQGANATMLADFDVPAGDYETAMVYVSDVNATLKSGQQVDVKLPSEKLHVNKPFTVGDGESVDFVFDMTVVEKGNSGGYNLKPVVAESGTDVEIRDVGAADDDDDGDEASLKASFVGNVSAGEEATLRVTNATGEPVEGAVVEVNGEVVGETTADGEIAFQVPDEDVEIEIEGQNEAELEFEGSVRDLATGIFSAGADDTDDGSDDSNDGNADDGSDDADDAKDSDDDADDDAENSSDDESVELAAAFTSNVQAGENATVAVTDGAGNPVENAVVAVDGDVVGETDANGELTFAVPSDADDVDVVITKGDAEVELDTEVAAAATA